MKVVAYKADPPAEQIIRLKLITSGEGTYVEAVNENGSGGSGRIVGLFTSEGFKPTMGLSALVGFSLDRQNTIKIVGETT